MSKRIEWVNSPHKLHSGRRGAGKNRYQVFLDACERMFIENGNEPIHAKDLIADARTKQGRLIIYMPPSKGVTQTLLKEQQKRFVRTHETKPMIALRNFPIKNGGIKNG